ncbi:hypothetical protein [Flavobacterium sp. SM2513]|uniref:hypothetical protein n=1 Tax=Flavobacterium sp. SM2513 TaxID=3424766 RepID=UPI003D7FA002
MEKPFKHIAFLLLAVFICCNALVANVSTQAISHTPFPTVAALHSSSLHSACDQESGYLQRNFSENQFDKNEFLPENDEDETEHFATKKFSAQNDAACFYHKQQLQLILPLAKSCTSSASHPLFFQSKTASSLYLIFEVFRI